MKKLFLGIFMISSIAINAQEFGVRFGEVTGNNVAVDAVFNTSSGSRIHADVSFGSGVGVDALWDFIYKPLGSEPFNWYAGVGPSVYINNNFLLGASGEIGLEYVFSGVPFVIGVDYRPTFWIIENTKFDWGGFGLNIRFRF